jgi:hypothetical protein
MIFKFIMNRQSIREKVAIIKGLLVTIGSEWIVILIVILVGFGGFALGRISALQSDVTPIQVSQAASASEANFEASEGLLVASRNGSKYHFPWCSGAQQIAERNKIWFDNEEEARRSGYTPAGNCRGLK